MECGCWGGGGILHPFVTPQPSRKEKGLCNICKFRDYILLNYGTNYTLQIYVFHTSHTHKFTHNFTQPYTQLYTQIYTLLYIQATFVIMYQYI